MNGAHETFMRRAIDLAIEGVDEGLGGPFGCVIVKDGEIIGEGNNRVTSTFDPTAHAEVVAIRAACAKLEAFQLDGCDIYTSCEPCPMCMGAIYWARPHRLYIACDRNDAADSGFDDAFIYDQLCSHDPLDRKIPGETILRDEGLEAFRRWSEKGDKIEY